MLIVIMLICSLESILILFNLSMICLMNLSSLLIQFMPTYYVDLTHETLLSLFDECNCSSNILMLTLNLKLKRKTHATQSNSLFVVFP